MKKQSLFPFILLILCIGTSLNAQTESKIRLNDNWKYLKGDLGNVWETVRPIVKPGNPECVPLWEAVTLPHCFNASDGVDPDVNYYQGPGWYKTLLALNNPFKQGRTILHFEGAGQKTEVYVYTTKVGSHIGGYDEWSVDITDAVNAFLQNKTLSSTFNGKIPLSIRCDNSRDNEMIPSSLADFNIYGGIYRYLNLIYVPALSIDRVNINTSVDSKGMSGKFDIVLKTTNKSSLTKANLKIEIVDAAGKVIVNTNQETETGDDERTVYSSTLKKPILWSPSQPNLYTCRVTLNSETGTQTVTEHFGFRNYEFTDNGPFMLNGKRLLIRGTHKHEDHAGVGAAMTEKQIREEMILIKEMGANFIRLGHYQQSRITLNLCDSLGIMVWEEIPWCRGGVGGDRYKKQAYSMMTNMITQHRNHPAVILWGLGNENDWPGDFPTYDKKEVRDFMSTLNDLAHKLDPSRKTSIRRCDFCKDIPDVYSPSIWAGWYKGIFTDYKTMSEKEMKTVKHFFHAEWGGDSHAGRFDERYDQLLQQSLTKNKDSILTLPNDIDNASKSGEWSESYICNLYDWTLKEQETMPNLTGAAFWTFKDFSTPVRPDNPVPYVNQKGVVERDDTKKESYFVFQSFWAEKPMVHIYGHSWPVRWGNAGEDKMVKVYSNCDEAELLLNGKSLGVKKRHSQDFPAAGLRWNVVYKQGENLLKVVARKGKVTVVDEITQSYQTDHWGKPAQMTLTKINQQGDIATLEVKLQDEQNILCLDARNVVTFGLAGDGKLLDNLGTSSGSRVVELQNGRAIIRVRMNAGSCVASVKCNNIPTVFCKLPD
ncbi:MAG: glycoside hydrolase family 2 TIM barrel-domain containing protein [Paludibacter sp.]|nr:glycoside hydrolase family 2 TIM barrel-domain containing protein [Paludibacter sp.]